MAKRKDHATFDQRGQHSELLVAVFCHITTLCRLYSCTKQLGRTPLEVEYLSQLQKSGPGVLKPFHQVFQTKSKLVSETTDEPHTNALSGSNKRTKHAPLQSTRRSDPPAPYVGPRSGTRHLRRFELRVQQLHRRTQVSQQPFQAALLVDRGPFPSTRST